MSSKFFLEFRDSLDNYIAPMGFSRLKIARNVSKPDILVCTTRIKDSLFDSYKLPDFIDRRIVAFEHNSSGGNPTYENTFLIRGAWKRKDHFEFLGVDARDFLHRRIIAYPAESSQSTKTGTVDNIMKAIVRESLGSSATADRQIQGLSISADVGAGPNITKSFAWKKIDETLQDLQLTSAILGTEVFYWVYPSGTGWIFETKTGQWGSDLAATQDMRLSESTKGLNILEEGFDASDEANYAYAGGQNTGAARSIEEVSTTRKGATIYNRCEIFVNATSEETAAGLQSAGYGKIGEHTPKISISGEIEDVPTFQYHKDWNLGDKFIVQTSLQSVKVQVRNVLISSDGNSDTVTAKIEG